MAELTKKRRRNKERVTRDDEDLTEGIPDVSDLYGLLDECATKQERSEIATENEAAKSVPACAQPQSDDTVTRSKSADTETAPDTTDLKIPDSSTKTEPQNTESNTKDQKLEINTGVSKIDMVLEEVKQKEVDVVETPSELIGTEHVIGNKLPEQESESADLKTVILQNDNTELEVKDNGATMSSEIEDGSKIEPCLEGEHLYPDLTEDLEKLKLDEQQQQETEENDDFKSCETSPAEVMDAHEPEASVSEQYSPFLTPVAEGKPCVPPKEEPEHPVALPKEENELLVPPLAQSNKLAPPKQDDIVPPIEDSKPFAPQHVESKAFAPPLEELAQEQLKKPSVVAERIRDEPQPLTREQLNSLYYNVKLENITAYIDKFIQREMKRETHEFYEILMNYQRARKHLLQCEAAVKTYEDDYRKNQGDVWITETCTATAKGTCGEGYQCSGTHTYKKSKLDYNALSRMTVALKNIQEQIQHELTLHSYEAQLSKLQVESYIHDLFANSPDLRNIPKNLPVNGYERHSPSLEHQVQKLVNCVSVLFIFHRLPIEDEEIIHNLQKWTERMISALLRIGTFEDHLFILNHLMRCPAGIGSWASLFVQAPPIPSNLDRLPLTFGNAHLDHVITALKTVLIPTSYRSEFMVQMQKMLQSGKDNKNLSWVMVDSDGEEDEDPQHAWLYLHENDVVAILKQLSLATVYHHVFFVSQLPAQDGFEYDVGRTSEATMYRVFAFSTCLVGILGEGLNTYSMARYRQLNKRLGRTIRQCVQLVTDHWENFRRANQGMLPGLSLQKLQLEYDAFFLRAVNLIHLSQRLGSWQYIADMPFLIITKATMWKILWLLHQVQGQHQWSHDITFIPPAEECMLFVKDKSCWSQLSDILQHVPPSEGVYLLNTMTNMAQCCSSADVDLIETVTMAIFEVSFICAETRDTCSKMGRELLSEVITCHPFMLSILTQKVNEYMDKLGQMGLYLYKGLSLETWLPTDSDMTVVRQWLLSSTLGSPKNMIAQQILSSINWGTSSKGERLMVPWHIHRQTALLVVEAYQKYIHGKHLGSTIMEGVKQVSAAVQQYQTAEQEFNSWCWSLLLKLSLHHASLPPEDQRLVAPHAHIPALNGDESLLPLGKGVKEKNPMACYVTLMLTRTGHFLEEFISEGISMFETLVEQGLFKPIISAIYYTCLMFIDEQKYILDSIRFQEVLISILRADESYFKVVKGLLSYDFPGPITKLFTSMVLSQVELCGKMRGDKRVSAVSLWTELLLHLPRWHQDRNICSVLNDLVQMAFTHPPALIKLQEIFTQHYKSFCTLEKHQGVMSALVSWVTSGGTLPSFLDKSSYGEFSWLNYMLLCLEGNFERDSNLWATIQEELLTHPKAGTEQCLKKAIQKLKLDQAPTWARLNILRWAQMVLDLPVDDPVAVLAWQRFFALYLGRLNVTQTSTQQRASVGERFFTSLGYSGMPKKMKKKLGQLADHYTKLCGESNVDTEDQEGSGSRDRKALLYKLTRLYHTLQLWIEEPLLHDTTLYLPSLPPQYQPDRLVTIFQGQTTPWMEYLDLQEISTSHECLISHWKQTSTPDQNPKTKEPKDSNKKNQSDSERILSRLARCDEPLPPPPIHPVKAPVPEIAPSIMENKSAILHLLEADMNTLIKSAGHHCSDMAKLRHLDDKYINLMPKLFTNVKQQVTIQLKCASMLNPLHKCGKPGATSIWIDEKRNDKIAQRQADENRAEYKQKLIECRVPFANASIIAAVHSENAITMIVKLSRSCTDERRYNHLADIACALFFRLGEAITDSVLEYPPTKQFFASCIDILGKEFIQCNRQQPENVMHLSLERSELGGMFAPHFKPNLAPPMFVLLYGRLAHRLQGVSGEKGQKGGRNIDLHVVSMLLTKFDVSGWLCDYNPSKQEVQTFVDHLSEAFIACGSQPQDGFLTLCQLYLSHEKKLLSHRFPLYLNEVLAALMQGSSAQRISVECWKVLLANCFYGNQAEGEGQKFPQVQTVLPIDQICHVLTWLGNEFTQKRFSGRQGGHVGLYMRWQLYVPCVAQLVRDLCVTLVDKMLPNLAESSSNEGIEQLWASIVAGFAPWLQTVLVQKVVQHPWSAEHQDDATHMVQALVHVVAYAHHRTHDIQQKFYNNFLSLLWLYFASVLCKEDASHDVVSIFNREFVKLPWQQLVPNLHVMDSMARLREVGCSLGFNLVSDVLSVIPWSAVSTWYESHYEREGQVRYQGCLFRLLIQAFSENKHVENPDIEQLLVQSTTYKWQHLTCEDFKSAASWLLQSCDPQCLLKGRTAPAALGIRLIESAAGFNVETSMMLTDSWTVKRLTYLHCVTSLLCQCTFQPECNPQALTTYIINLLTEIETVESAVSEMHIQLEESTALMKEILSLLNNSNPDNQGSEVILAAILDWLQGSPQTILLTPCIHAATRNLASLEYMARIVEKCIELMFVPGGQAAPASDPWLRVLAAVQAPELGLTEFFEACIQESAFLLMYSYVLQRLPLCQNLAEEQGVMEMILDWCDTVKPSADNEGKLLLWCFKMFDLILRQMDYGNGGASSVTLLRKVVAKLTVFGEDRATVGLLGAIGLGRKSQLSEKFRVCSRALAAFASNQTLSDDRLRLHPADHASCLPAASKDTQQLLSIKTNKKYQPIKSQVELVCDYVTDQSKSLRDVIGLVTLLKDSFYPSDHYLSVIKVSWK